MEDYHSYRHWQFHHGVVDDGQGGLVANRDFVGDSFGWTGGYSSIGRQTQRDGGEPQEQRWWVTMVTPTFGLTAGHTSSDFENAISVSKGRQVHFYHTDDPCGTFELATVKDIHRVTKYADPYTTYKADLSLVEFESPVSSAVRKMRIKLPREGENFDGEDIVIVGRDWLYPHYPTRDRLLSQRFALDTIRDTGFQVNWGDKDFKTLCFSFFIDDPNNDNEGAPQFGDSGAPCFLRKGSFLYLIGVNVYRIKDTSSVPGLDGANCVEVYSYVNEIQALINSTGSTETLTLSY